jgi:hypothetical protein
VVPVLVFDAVSPVGAAGIVSAVIAEVLLVPAEFVATTATPYELPPFKPVKEVEVVGVETVIEPVYVAGVLGSIVTYGFVFQ